MSNLEYKEFYRRYLPHFQPEAATLFVTFRLEGSLPLEVIERWTRERRSAERSRDTEHAASRLVDHRRRFAEMEELLHKAVSGPQWLKDPEIAKLVSDSLHHRDGKVYRLDCYCIMPNHVHIVFAPLPRVAQAASLREVISPKKVQAPGSPGQFISQAADHSMASILHSLKSYTAQQANRVLDRTGQFWEHESYDRAVRNELEWARTIAYVINNPVKAGLAARWDEWPWSYSRFG